MSRFEPRIFQLWSRSTDLSATISNGWFRCSGHMQPDFVKLVLRLGLVIPVQNVITRADPSTFWNVTGYNLKMHLYFCHWRFLQLEIVYINIVYLVVQDWWIDSSNSSWQVRWLHSVDYRPSSAHSYGQRPYCYHGCWACCGELGASCHVYGSLMYTVSQK